MADSSTDLKASFTAISNGISWLHREHDGRGADRIRTVIPYDMVLTMLGDANLRLGVERDTGGASGLPSSSLSG